MRPLWNRVFIRFLVVLVKVEVVVVAVVAGDEDFKLCMEVDRLVATSVRDTEIEYKIEYSGMKYKLDLLKLQN